MPELELIRLDADTAGQPGTLRDALERFADADRAVLVGTQMVAKGHHFPGVSLAAVVDADTGLALPDFRAEERTFQLVTQLAGRSGRDAPGKVIVQSFQPDATPLRYAARHDVAGFLAEELGRRRELGYPPFRHLISIVAAGPDADAPAQLLRELQRGLGRRRPARPRRRCCVFAAATGRSSSRRPNGPRALAARAAQLLAAAAPGDAARRRHRRRRRRPAVALAPLHSRACRRRRGFASRTRPRPRSELDAEARARRRLALAQIRQYPDAVLRMQAREVESFDDDLARLAEKMARLMHDARRRRPGCDAGRHPAAALRLPASGEEEPTTVVNPAITKRSRSTEVEDEGCLSLQGVLVPVERAREVTLEGQDVTASPATRARGHGRAGRQHELDHLDGVLMLERTDDESRREALAVLRRSI